MKYFSLTIIGITSIVLVACNQNNTSNKLYVPKEIQWDTLKNGFGENIDLYHKAFEVLYISNDTIYKINMENELVDDSILMISPLSIIERYLYYILDSLFLSNFPQKYCYLYTNLARAYLFYFLV